MMGGGEAGMGVVTEDCVTCALILLWEEEVDIWVEGGSVVGRDMYRGCLSPGLAHSENLEL
jgi:hypothetical protein